jgi:uncharacterized membrane protein
MVLAGRLHPLLVHFPIALILCAAAAELLAMATHRPVWQALGFIQTRVGALGAAGTAAAGWLLASAPEIDQSSRLEWHRWLAVLATAAALLAAAATLGAAPSASRRRAYRALLFGSAAVTGLAAHLGATLVWGAHFLHF